MDEEVQEIVRSRRSQKTPNPERAALLQKVSKIRSDREREREVSNAFWPAVADNDARLFEDSAEQPTSENPVDDSSDETIVKEKKPADCTVKVPGMRRLCKVKAAAENADEQGGGSSVEIVKERKPVDAAKVPGRRFCKVKPDDPHAQLFQHTVEQLDESPVSVVELNKTTDARKAYKVAEPLPMADELAAAELVDLPSDTSESHVSIADDDDGVDDILCSKLGSLSLKKKDSKAKTSIFDIFAVSNSTDYGSAASGFDSGSTKEVPFVVCDDFEAASSTSRKLSSQLERGKSSKADSGSIILEGGKMKFVLAGEIATKLYAHQREGVRWLWGLHTKRMGGILGDDMGLGKTMQTAAFLAGLFSSRLIKRALIVAPKTLIPHWEKELSVVGLGRKVKDYSGTSVSVRESNLQNILQCGGVLLTTYDIVRFNTNALKGEHDVYGNFGDDSVTWDYLILDEGHLIKNPSTQRAKSLKEIPSGHRIIISGTPIQNNLREMWALYDFCCPELLGDRKEFKAKYENLILSGNDKHASDRQRRIGSAAAQELRDRIAPYFLRRMKCEVFPSTGQRNEQQLAKKNDIIVWLRLSQRQRQMYTAFLRSETASQSLDGSAVLAALTILKKICDHPLLLTKRAADDVVEGLELDGVDVAAAEDMRASIAGLVGDTGSQNEHSCKIVFLMALLDNLVQEGHRTLIFAQTLKMLDIIQEELARRRYRFCRIDGKSKGADRQRIVEEFQNNSRISIFLLTSQVGGLGLTLTGADRVVIVDPAWNPSKDNQSVDRAYRIGQSRDVIVYRLMTSGTLEEKIYRKQVFKGGLMKVATEKKEQFRYFSQQELRELLTVPKTGFDISPTQQQLHEEHAHQFKEDGVLSEHIKFLEGQGIAGVSHHDLLFSKAAPDLPPPSEDEVNASSRMFGSSTVHGSSKHRTKTVEKVESSSSAHEPQSGYWKGTHRVNLIELDDNQLNTRNLQDNISRLSAMLSNRGR